jgi:hypothetical protein
VLECVASDYEYRAKIYGKQPGAECGNLAGHEQSKAKACRAAILAIAPYLSKCDQCHGKGSYHVVKDGGKKRIFCDHNKQ